VRLPRPRLLIAALVGIVAAAAAPHPLGAPLRAVVGWDFAASTYLILVLIMAARADAASMRRRAAGEDLARWAFLALMAGAAFFSMFAILGPVHEAKTTAGGITVGLVLLGGFTILLSWLSAHTAFAIHYAHEFYAKRGPARPPGLIFPGKAEAPDYWDFLYFSFVIGMTCQVSDVQVATKPWRRLVLIHGVVSFLFNTVVLALSINLVAGLL
jgi:uncharacterized membrane protein